MFSWLKNLFSTTPILGALRDTRSYEEAIKDISFNEIVAKADPVTWVEKSPNEWRKFSVRNQDGSSSCVAQSIAKMSEVLYFIKTGSKLVFSAGFYKFRSNYPEEGMIGANAFSIWSDKGIPLEALVPSQNKSEFELNKVDTDAIDLEHAKSFAIDKPIYFEARTSFEQVASTIQKTQKPVMVWFTFNRDEWTDIPTIKTQYPNLAHSVTAVDTTLYNGKKYLVIEDSWGKFNNWEGQRLISEEFYKARNFFAAYPMTFKLLPESNSKPSHIFTTNLYFGSNNSHILALQDILKYEGCFPVNVSSTGYYGSATAEAVLKYQKKHQVASEATLEGLAGRQVGPATIKKLNEQYGG